ncbi:transposable element Tc1 transposase [Trichonephila clavipes]|nr:transposable element Tc1 transposase [Trichonephila clavipes]
MRIMCTAVMDHVATSQTIPQQILSASPHSVPAPTIPCRLQQSRLSTRCPLLHLPLTGNHRCLLGQWCDERWAWTTEWCYIVFTDESRFCLQHHYGWIRYHGLVGIGYHCRTLIVRIASTVNSQHYISEVLELVVLSYIQRLPPAIFLSDNAGPHVKNIQKLFFTHQIELLSLPACSSDLLTFENVWPMLEQQMVRDTSPVATPYQLWQYLEAAWTTVPKEYILWVQ